MSSTSIPSTSATTGSQVAQLSDSCRQLFDSLADSGIERFWMVNQNGRLTCSHPKVETVCEQLEQLPDYDDHEAVLVELNRESHTIFAAFIHSTSRGQAQGGVRLLDHVHYGSFKDLLVDGLRLARGMTEKNAMAEIWWGGGKGIICPVDNRVADFKPSGSDDYPLHRERLFKNYGLFIASIGGIYITAEDMNTSPQDMKTIHSECRFVTCLPPEIGGSSNPSRFTAEGTFVSMVAGLKHLDPSLANPLKGKVVLMQGVGNVGRPLLDMIIEAGAKAIVFDPNKEACNDAVKQHGSNRVTIFEDASPAGFDKFIELEADVFSPNAIGAIVTASRIPRMKVKLIAGAANNQLQTRGLAESLESHGILYLPDFLINCMGIVNCANEQYGYTEAKIKEQVEKLKTRVTSLLRKTGDGQSVDALAIQQSQELAAQQHPIWPRNGQELIQSLIESDWAKVG